MKITMLQIFYGLIAIIGLFVTWYFNLQAREANFIADMYSNSASTSISNDLIVVVTVFLVWSFVETRRLNMSYRFWTGLFVCTFFIAAAVTVPTFLLFRERHLIARNLPATSKDSL